MSLQITKPTLLILNGSIHGSAKNCGWVIRYLRVRYKTQFRFLICNLKDQKKSDLLKKIKSADAFLVLTGTYWESWGSPLQKFFEDFTSLETHPKIMGKPASALVLCHSTGGKSVLSRLLANLNLFGFLIPPLCGIEISHVSQMVHRYGNKVNRDDLWHLDDTEVMMHNLLESLSASPNYRSWVVDKKDYRKKWIR